MNHPIKNILALPKGMLLFLGIYAASFPVIWLEAHLTQRSMLLDWLGLSPALVWKGQVWRVLTYALLDGGILGWAVFLFWLATLTSILARDWSSKSYWAFCLFAAFAGALPFVLFMPQANARVVGVTAVIFALLVAWDRNYRRERILMLGLGEVSVRQAAIIIGVINALITFFSCGGWLATLSMLCGGVAGWIYLAVGQRRVMSRGSRAVESERIARLEL
jgi:membrane associated rhomboid family serine protease